MKKVFSIIALDFILIFCLANIPLAAADYPTKPITLINPFSAGGALGMVGRSFSSVAGKYLGQPVVVINKPGASGMIGGLAGAQAASDGYTLTIGSSNMTSAIEWDIAERRKPAFTRHDFINIASLTLSPPLVIVPYNSSWKTLGDLINDCKAKPGHYAFSIGGLYAISHVPAELLVRAIGVKARHVPYKGGGPAISAVVGGHVDFSTQYPSSSAALLKGNKLRALAVLSNKRLKFFPDIPTVKELGIDAEYYAWIGICAPLKTPMPIVEKLRKVAKKVAEDKLFTNTIENLADEVHYMTGDELTSYWDIESEKTAKLYKQMIEEKK